MTASETVGVGTLLAGPGECVQGYLAVDLSEQDVRVPVTVLNGHRPGPRMAVTAGIHGAEYPPIEATRRLMSDLEPGRLTGSVVVAHIANPVAFQKRSVFSSGLEEKNLARCFPGTPKGSPTERLADALFRNIISPADLFIDLHGGDMIEALAPFSAIVDTPQDPHQVQVAERMARAFGIRFLNRSKTTGSAYYTAAKAGIPSLLAEAGGQGLLTEKEVGIHLRGLRNVLTEFGMIPGQLEPGEGLTRLKEASYVRGATSGLSCLHVSVGEFVKEGQKLGTITDPFGGLLEEILAPVQGYVLYLISTLAINKGELFMAIGVPE